MPTKGTEFLRVPAVSLRRRSIASYRARSIPRLHFGQITDFLGNKSLYGQCQLGLCTLSASLNWTVANTGPRSSSVGVRPMGMVLAMYWIPPNWTTLTHSVPELGWYEEVLWPPEYDPYLIGHNRSLSVEVPP